jgi:hypothetical protein
MHLHNIHKGSLSYPQANIRFPFRHGIQWANEIGDENGVPQTSHHNNIPWVVFE